MGTGVTDIFVDDPDAGEAVGCGARFTVGIDAVRFALAGELLLAAFISTGTGCATVFVDGVEVVVLGFVGESLLDGLAAAFAAETGVAVVEAMAAKKPAGNGTGDSLGGIYRS